MTNQVSSVIFPVIIVISIFGFGRCQLQENPPVQQPPLFPPQQQQQPQQPNVQQQQQSGRYQVVEDGRQDQWYYAYWYCKERGGELVDITNGISAELSRVITDYNSKMNDILKYRRNRLVPMFWTRQKCQGFYMGSVNQPVSFGLESCYWRKSIICQFDQIQN